MAGGGQRVVDEGVERNVELDRLDIGIAGGVDELQEAARGPGKIVVPRSEAGGVARKSRLTSAVRETAHI